MQKIISLFKRNYETDRLVRDEVVPGAEWVIAGEGVATRKWDGSCCMVRDSKLFKRYELKRGKPAPIGFEAAQDADPITGSTPGWLPVGEGPEDKWFRAAFNNAQGDGKLPDGTYEAIGSHFGGGSHDKNPEGCECDTLVSHHSPAGVLNNFPRTFEGIRQYFSTMGDNEPSIEGVVWHHADGRMVKIKARDFGIKRSAPASHGHADR